MGVEEFLDLFVKELEVNGDLRQYYKLINSKSKYYWRKAYLEQRLRFIWNNTGNGNMKIWDVGCGYATTAIFLALNGHEVTGTTLEFYYDKIDSRRKYWSQFGNLSNLEISYANLFDMPVKPATYDVIVAQDTLHHLEPIDSALDIFHSALKPEGIMAVSEENGQSLFISAKNFLKRGNRRISYYYDERLQKSIPFGNENARSMETWLELLATHGFHINQDDMEYMRKLPPFFYNERKYKQMISRDKTTIGLASGLDPWLYFGINFIAKNKSNMKDTDPVPVVVYAGTQWEASLVKSLMDNAEIESFLKDEIRGTTMPWQVAPGGIGAVKVVVSSHDLERAKQVVDQFESSRTSDN